MKAEKEDTDQSAEVSIYADGELLQEYALGCEPRDPNIVECFIPVKPGQTISVLGHFSGSVLEAFFDLVLDGSFSQDSRTEGKHDLIKYLGNRKIKFDEVLTRPKPSHWISSEWPKLTLEGKVLVKALEEEVTKDLSQFETPIQNSFVPGLGSIVVVINVNQDHRDTYDPKSQRDPEVGRWRRRGDTTVRESGIPPDHELELDIKDQAVSKKRSEVFKRHWESTRPGSNYWAKFVFYYRNLDVILDAGGFLIPEDHIQQLEPGDLSSFVCGQGSSGLKVKPQSGFVKEEDDEDDDIFPQEQPTKAELKRKLTERPGHRTGLAKQGATERQEEPSKKKEPKKRLGGPLKAATGPSDPPDTKEMEMHRNERVEQYLADSAVPSGEMAADHSQDATYDPDFAELFGEEAGLDGDIWNGEAPEDQDDEIPPDESRPAADDGYLSYPDDDSPLQPELQTATLSARATPEVKQPSPQTMAPQQTSKPANRIAEVVPDEALLPSVDDIRAAIQPGGVPRSALAPLFLSGQPYQNQEEAQETFKARIHQVARSVKVNGIKRWLLLEEVEERRRQRTHTPLSSHATKFPESVAARSEQQSSPLITEFKQEEAEIEESQAATTIDVDMANPEKKPQQAKQGKSKSVLNTPRGDFKPPQPPNSGKDQAAVNVPSRNASPGSGRQRKADDNIIDTGAMSDMASPSVRKKQKKAKLSKEAVEAAERSLKQTLKDKAKEEEELMEKARQQQKDQKAEKKREQREFAQRMAEVKRQEAEADERIQKIREMMARGDFPNAGSESDDDDEDGGVEEYDDGGFE